MELEQEQEQDQEQEQEQNEEPPADVPEDFCDNIRHIKFTLYETTVLSPALGTAKAQDTGLLETYLAQLNQVHQLANRSIQGYPVLDRELLPFPVSLRDIIKTTMIWIQDFFKKNQIADTIPVADYMERTLRVNPFIQRGGLFIEE